MIHVRASERAPLAVTPRVAHVAESFSSGVRSAILDYVSLSAEFEHHLFYSARDDAPLVDEEFTGFASATRLPSSHRNAVRYLRGALDAYDIVHSHSSFGGLYARLARSRRSVSQVYTPHCFAFERADINPVSRLAYRAAELLLGMNTTSIAACSERETDIARTIVGAARSRFVPNSVDPDVPRRTSTYKPGTRALRVVGSGRNSAQKDPAFFLDAVKAARSAGHEIDALWIGGDAHLQEQGSAEDVQVTGWVSREEAIRLVSQADIYLHTARWEGFPVAVLEAIVADVPVIVRDSPAFAKLPLARVTTPSSFSDELLGVDEQSLQTLVHTQQSCLQTYSRTTQQRALIELYLDCLGERAGLS